MWVILLTLSKRIFEFASMSITLGIIICTDLVLPSCDSADREGGIFIGNIVNSLGALHPRILVGGDSAATAAASPERQSSSS